MQQEKNWHSVGLKLNYRMILKNLDYILYVLLHYNRIMRTLCVCVCMCVTANTNNAKKRLRERKHSKETINYYFWLLTTTTTTRNKVMHKPKLQLAVILCMGDSENGSLSL